MTRALTLAVLGLAACGSNDLAGEAAPSVNDLGFEAETFVFTVVPADQRELGGAVRVFPQDFGPFSTSEISSSLELALLGPVRLNGVVTGEEVTPYAADGGLPTQLGAVAGHVEVANAVGEVQYTAASDESSGAFVVNVLPGDWEVRVVPNAGSLAPKWASFSADSAPVRQDFLLEPEQAIYGQVLMSGAAYSGAAVFAVDAAGRTSGTAYSDESGRYEIRVPAGNWEVSTTGVPGERDPLIHVTDARVTNQLGTEINLEYPEFTRILATLQVNAADGSPVGGIPVRFTATALDGFPFAELVIEDEVSSDGRVDLPLVPGVYVVEILPGDGTLDGWHAEGVAIHVGGTFDNVALQPLQTLSGLVIEVGGTALAGARVTCDELGAAGRSWLTFSDSAGLWGLLVAQQVTCAAVPPGDQGDLAILHTVIDTSVTTTWNPRLSVGVPVEGTVTVNGNPEPFAVVEARDELGQIVGQGLSDADGLFALTLPAAP